jgi:hypothetical protein
MASYTQTFVILKGSIIFVYAPANLKGDHDLMPLDYDRFGAFVMDPGDVAHINRGVWHGGVVLGTSCRFVNVTRRTKVKGHQPRRGR